MATRVYEYAKQLGVPSKELLTILQNAGFDISTHMAVLPEKAITFLDAELKQKKSAQKSPTKEVSLVPNQTPLPQKKVEVKPPTVEKTGKKTIPVAQQKVVTQKIDIEQPIVEKKEEPGIALTSMTVAEFATKARRQVSEVILSLLRQGIVATKNQVISEKVVANLAKLYNLPIIQPATQPEEAKTVTPLPKAGTYKERLPVVVVIGHVDHGKTTLLDFIRSTRVAAREKGGITQHLGAYEVQTPQGNVVFLDTPGHEAFSMMRARGIKVADIAVLVVAADDGVMPQTVEAIKRAQAAGIPIIVAINKIDKATPAQIENVKRSLATYNLMPEEWGGQTVMVPISAKFGTGITELLEVIVLQAQLLELSANMSIPAQGYILESKMEKGLGPVATVICQHGTLHVGDYFIAGTTQGKVSLLIDSYGKRIKEVGPSVPVQVAGFTVLPQVGDPFRVVSQQELKKAKAISVERPQLPPRAAVSAENSINIIIKTDTLSSKEALLTAISKLPKVDDKEFYVVSAAVGDVTESDIFFARDTNAIIYGLHVKAEPNANVLAVRESVTIKLFDVIYKLLEDLSATAIASKAVKMVLKKIGEAVVLKVFDIKDVGVIAGAQVKSGRCTKDSQLVIYRGKQKIGSGPIKSLQRERKSVKEVHAGFECAFLVEGFDAWEPDDRVECYLEVPEQS